MNMTEDNVFPMAFILGMMTFLISLLEHLSMCCASHEMYFWEASLILCI